MTVEVVVSKRPPVIFLLFLLYPSYDLLVIGVFWPAVFMLYAWFVCIILIYLYQAVEYWLHSYPVCRGPTSNTKEIFCKGYRYFGPLERFENPTFEISTSSPDCIGHSWILTVSQSRIWRRTFWFLNKDLILWSRKYQIFTVCCKFPSLQKIITIR